MTESDLFQPQLFQGSMFKGRKNYHLIVGPLGMGGSSRSPDEALGYRPNVDSLVYVNQPQAGVNWDIHAVFEDDAESGMRYSINSGVLDVTSALQQAFRIAVGLSVCTSHRQVALLCKCVYHMRAANETHAPIYSLIRNANGAAA